MVAFVGSDNLTSKAETVEINKSKTNSNKPLFVIIFIIILLVFKKFFGLEYIS